MNRSTRLLVLSVMFLSFWPFSSRAAGETRPVYNENIEAATRDRIVRFLAILGLPSLSIDIAQTDLNGDRVPEFVVRLPGGQTACPQEGCDFLILADTEDGLVLLGRMQAFSLAVSSGNRTAGIADLLLYQHRENDFLPTAYVWSPEKSRYRPRQAP